MPLDGHAHLVSQGWSGKGSGLRHGAIAKPVTVVQKKTLAGIGKDRDEAFPFWDHVFQAAAVSISVKVHNSDDESDSDSEQSSTPATDLKRTSTGIISNRRPTSGTPALSGTTTPSDSQPSGSVTPRLSVMAAAKQQAARRMLYSMFYRGPVLSNEDEKSVTEESTGIAGPSTSTSSSLSRGKTKDGTREHKKSKKRKADKEVDEDPKERKRRKHEAKEKEGERKKRKDNDEAAGKAPLTGKRDKEEEKLDEAEDGEGVEDVKAAKLARKAEKAERKRQKAEKRARKEERRKRKLERKAARMKSDAVNSDSEEETSESQDKTGTTALDVAKLPRSPSHTPPKKQKVRQKAKS
ncbi:hypothetical protein C8Q76DRAFT_803369 [Earliella scabrosa]|nr:hypothetical protein C8Q76DRAFT_803369 [Earliella scabrosa]